MIKPNFHRNGTHPYDDIQRGTSLSIPVTVCNEDDEAIDISDYEVCFTIKKESFDFDRNDDFAYVKKDFAPQDPTNGKFNVLLSSDDTDFAPGDYFFDIELVGTNRSVVRLITCPFKLVGGPSNRKVNSYGAGSMIALVGIHLNLISGKPIIVFSPSLTGDQIANFEARIAELERKVGP